ncbi:MAG: diguanylate cyclase [Anaerolineae bacterium]|nr:MAG: diguanylate cyclase [Anaerolineae bacterium]
MKILIFHPDADQRAFLTKCLSQGEFDLVQSTTADETMTALHIEDDPVRIVIAPYEHGAVDGVELINSLLAADLPTYPYIIFISDEARRKNVIDSLGPIPGDFVLNPVVEDELLARLQIAERTIALQTRLSHAGSGQSESLALYDQLTSVLNRQAIYERALGELNRAQREGVTLSVALIEVGNLNDIRGEYGADVRDQALRFVARAVRANVRIYDLVGRWIGAKFLLMLPGAAAENARAVLERITRSVTTIRISTPEGGRVQLDVRAGFTCTRRDDPQPLYILIEQANQALATAQEPDAELVVEHQPVQG